MVKHELNNFENLESHHIPPDFKDVLDTSSVYQINFDELFDRNKGIWNLNSGLTDWIIEICWVDKLFFNEWWQVIPNSCLLRDLYRLQRFPIHVKMQQNSHEKRSHFIWQLIVLDETLHSIE